MLKTTSSNQPFISVVAPVYGCNECLKMLYDRLQTTLSKITENFEIILVDDASPDDTWNTIEALAKKDDRVKGVHLSKNFGQHYAITAGLDYSKGEWVVVMDCDLQDQPEEIEKLYNKAVTGYDQVVAVRENRQDRFLTRITSKLFYIVFNYLSDQTLDNRVANFGIYSRQVIDSIKCYKEQDRSFGLLAVLVGFKRAEIAVDHASRATGKSTYNVRKRITLALEHILSHSNKPLLLTVKMGFLFSLGATIYGSWLILRYFLWFHVTEGWTSVIVSLFFLSGLIVSVIGMLGIYIGKIYNEVKNRPLYIVKNTTFKTK